MSLVKNISGGPLEVPLLDLRTVEADETVEVPDFQAGHSPADAKAAAALDPPRDVEVMAIVWPADKWEPVSVPAVKPEKAAKDTTSKAAG
jgi:hypothetical protein